MSVKLVAEPGVGTVAAGVAKAYADLITISGYDGGTGASPLSSIKYAGTPWELGLAETHQTLRAQRPAPPRAPADRRRPEDRPRRGQGGASSARRASASAPRPMVALGCKYLRICHLNNCATGVATQHNVLRIEVLHRPAGDGHQLLPLRGARKCARSSRAWACAASQDIIGRTEYLRDPRGQTPRQRKLDLHADPVARRAWPPMRRSSARTPVERALRQGRARRAHGAATCCRPSRARAAASGSYEVRNYNRSIGARLSGEIARRWGNYGMEDAPLTVRLQRQRRAELRCLERRRPAPVSRGRCQRLRRQGHGGRARSCCAIRAAARYRRERHDHHGQHLPVRRHRRRSCSPPASRASASRCATPARSRSSRARAITAAST